MSLGRLGIVLYIASLFAAVALLVAAARRPPATRTDVRYDLAEPLA
jgi:hypothetical protein